MYKRTSFIYKSNVVDNRGPNEYRLEVMTQEWIKTRDRGRFEHNIVKTGPERGLQPHRMNRNPIGTYRALVYLYGGTDDYDARIFAVF